MYMQTIRAYSITKQFNTRKKFFGVSRTIILLKKIQDKITANCKKRAISKDKVKRNSLIGVRMAIRYFMLEMIFFIALLYMNGITL